MLKTLWIPLKWWFCVRVFKWVSLQLFFIIIIVQPNIIEIKCFVCDTFLVQRPPKMVTVVAMIVYWIYSYMYLCNQCLSPLKLWVRIPLRRDVLDTTLCDKVCQWLVEGQMFSAGSPISTTNKTDRNDITEILLKVAFNTMIPPQKTTSNCNWIVHNHLI